MLERAATNKQQRSTVSGTMTAADVAWLCRRASLDYFFNDATIDAYLVIFATASDAVALPAVSVSALLCVYVWCVCM